MREPNEKGSEEAGESGRWRVATASAARKWLHGRTQADSWRGPRAGAGRQRG